MADTTAPSLGEDWKVYRGAHEVFRLRTARKGKRCDYSRDTSWFRFCTPIAPGQQYIHVTVYPGHDVVQTDKPATGACCLPCAEGYTGMDTITRALASGPTGDSRG